MNDQCNNQSLCIYDDYEGSEKVIELYVNKGKNIVKKLESPVFPCDNE